MEGTQDVFFQDATFPKDKPSTQIIDQSSFLFIPDPKVIPAQADTETNFGITPTILLYATTILNNVITEKEIPSNQTNKSVFDNPEIPNK